MTTTGITIKGYDELVKALKKNPEVVKNEAQKYFVRSMATYKGIINNNPWQVGGGGGGVPVATRNLQRIGHETVFNDFAAYLKVRTDQVPYAGYVHEGTKFMEKRPWLDYAVEQGQGTIEKLQDDLLNDIVKQLAD